MPASLPAFARGATRAALISVLALSIAAVAPACRKKADTDPPVATPGFSVNKSRVPLGSPVEVTYKFVVSPDAKLEGDHRVMVHFMDADEEMMWTDDHEPPTPTSKWQPGQTIEYKRTVFIPLYPYNGTATVLMGLYSRQDGRRLPLAGETPGQRAYKVGTIELLPRSENIFLVFRDGWHPEEVATDNAAITWQWTKREATLSFRNPKKDSTLYLHFDGRPDLFAPAVQRISVTCGDQTLDTYELTSRDEVIRRIAVPAAHFGTGDTSDVKITVDPPFVPALVPATESKDPRELGIRVFHAFVEPK
jgi:hypothetical protein